MPLKRLKITDATAEAKRIARGSDGGTADVPPCDWSVKRSLAADRFSSYPENGTTERLESNDMGFLFIGSEQVDIRGIFSLLTAGQRTAAAFILRAVMIAHRPGPLDFEAELDAVFEKIRAKGLHELYTAFFTTMSMPMEMPRRIDMEAVVNRMRRLKWILPDGR